MPRVSRVHFAQVLQESVDRTIPVDWLVTKVGAADAADGPRMHLEPPRRDRTAADVAGAESVFCALGQRPINFGQLEKELFMRCHLGDALDRETCPVAYSFPERDPAAVGGRRRQLSKTSENVGSLLD